MNKINVKWSKALLTSWNTAKLFIAATFNNKLKKEIKKKRRTWIGHLILHMPMNTDTNQKTARKIPEILTRHSLSEPYLESTSLVYKQKEN